MPVFSNFVLEVSNNPGTSTFVLSGAPAGRRNWSGAFTDGEVYYVADDGTQAEWGIGRFTRGVPATISRDTILGTTQDRAVRLNFTGLTHVYSALPAEAFPHSTLQGLTVVPDKNWVAQNLILGSCDVTVTGTTLRADFAATLRVSDGGAGASGFQVVRLVVGIYGIDAQGETPVQPIAAAGSNLRLETVYQLGGSVSTLANVTPRSTLRIKASIQVLGSSRAGVIYGMTLQDGSITWINA